MLLHAILRGSDRNVLVRDTAILETKYESSIPRCFKSHKITKTKFTETK